LGFLNLPSVFSESLGPFETPPKTPRPGPGPPSLSALPGLGPPLTLFLFLPFLIVLRDALFPCAHGHGKTESSSKPEPDGVSLPDFPYPPSFFFFFSPVLDWAAVTSGRFLLFSGPSPPPSTFICAHPGHGPPAFEPGTCHCLDPEAWSPPPF